MNPDGQAWMAEKATRFLRRVGLKKGQTVLDFGCNGGNYTRVAARVVGPSGTVYALDKDCAALEEFKRDASERDIGNIEYLCVSEDDGIPLPSRSVDVVLLYDVLHGGYFPERGPRAHLLRDVRSVLKLGGLLSLYPTHLKKYGLTFEQIRNEVQDAGFSFEAESRRRLVHDGNLVRGHVLAFRKEARQQCGGNPNGKA